MALGSGPFLNSPTEKVPYLRGKSLQGMEPHRAGLGSPKLQEPGPGVPRARSIGKGEVFGAALSRRDEPRRRSAEELEEAGLAVGLAGALLEGALGERAQAEGAGEVVRVEAAA